MLRRLTVLALLLLCMPLVARAQRQFFIDAASGSNANNGTSVTTPWKSHPSMQTNATCTGGVTGWGGYVHQAGDTFIFKGGVTWPAQCFQMKPTAGGSSNTTRDVYTTQSTYFAGASFTKPVFDLANTAATGGNNFINLTASGGNITFNGIELKRQRVTSNGQTPCDAASINLFGLSNVTLSNLLVHDWMATGSTGTGWLQNHDTGSICSGGTQSNNIVDTVESHDQNGVIGANAIPFGACFRNITEVKNSHCHHVGDGDVGFGKVHDSEFNNITNASAFSTGDPTLHTNVIETFFDGAQLYNLYVHDNNPIGLTISICPASQIYNSLFVNNGNATIIIDPAGAGNTCGSMNAQAIYNNTIVPAGSFAIEVIQRTGFTLTAANWQNNHIITNSAAFCFNGSGCGTITSPVTTFNVIQSTATAAAQGFTAANLYQPTAATNSTVKAGTNLTSLCGTFTSMCTDKLGFARPVSPTNWDVGAYQFQGSVVPPSPPTSLAASVSGGTVTLTATPSSGSPIPTGYSLYRGTIHNGPYSLVSSGLASPNTTDTPASGTYFYVETAFVGGIVSTVSGNGTTATVTCTAACSFPSGTVFVIGGDSQSAFNGTFTSTGQPTSSTFTFASTTSATGTGGGVWPSAAESTRSNEAQATVGGTLTVAFAPTSLTFGSFAVGSSSPTQMLTVTNTSGAGNTVTISSVSFTGTNPGDFSQLNTCGSLAPGQQCIVTAKFTPTSPGARSANLTFVDNAAGSPQTVPVSGTGVAQAPAVTLVPTSLTFPAQLLTTTSPSQAIVLQNSGTGTLSISSISASGDFGQSNTCGATLGAGLTCTINATFTPIAAGLRTGSVSITDNAAGSPHTASLSGTGIQARCTLSGTTVLTGITIVCHP